MSLKPLRVRVWSVILQTLLGERQKPITSNRKLNCWLSPLLHSVTFEWMTYSSVHPCMCSFTHQCIHSSVHLFPPCIHLFIHALIHPLGYSPVTHPGTHSRISAFIYSSICGQNEGSMNERMNEWMIRWKSWRMPARMNEKMDFAFSHLSIRLSSPSYVH